MGAERPHFDQTVERLPEWLKGTVTENDLTSLFSSDKKIGQLTTIDVSLNGKPYMLDYAIIREGLLSARLGLTPQHPIPTSLPFRAMSSTLRPDEASMNIIHFEYPGEPGFVQATAFCTTRPEFEGQGLGTFLAHLSDATIEDVIRRLPDDFSGKRTYAVILDFARFNDLRKPDVHTGWSARIAQQLGYPRDKGSRLEMYRKNFF